MNRLEFGCQKLSKWPDMIGEPRRHSRGSWEPLELNQSGALLILGRERQSQTYVRPGKVVEGLKEDHAPSHLGPIFTETPALADQRGQRMPQGQVETLKQTGTDRDAQCLQPSGPAAHAVH